MMVTDFELIQTHVLKHMGGLDTRLTYHCIEHTLDVIKHSTRIALDEGVNEKETYLLAIAALYHDTGFLYTYAGHEKRSCEIFIQDTNVFDFTEGEKNIILELIMSTKVPQLPKNLLQKIICDADLDYLGRNDFTEIAERLRKEFFRYRIVANLEDWQSLQMRFLQKHQYHTNSSRLLREPLKKLNLAGIMAL